MDQIEGAIATDYVYPSTRPVLIPAEKPIICTIKLNQGGYKGAMLLNKSAVTR